MSTHVLTLDCMYGKSYCMDMVRKKKMVTLTVEPDLWARLEKWISEQDFPPAKNAVVEVALTKWLDEQNAT